MNYLCRKSLVITLFLVVVSCPTVLAQATKSKITETSLVWVPDSDPDANQTFVLMKFDAPLNDDNLPKITDVVVIAMPSGTLMSVKSLDTQGGNSAVLAIQLNPNVPPKADDTSVEVRFKQLQFDKTPAETQANIKGTGELYAVSNIAKLREKRVKALKEAAAAAKTTREKNIFAGFSAAAPSGEDAEGNAEIHLNRWVSPQFFVSFNLLKSSAEKADPKQFNLALTYRKVFGMNNSAIEAANRKIAAAEAEAMTNPDPDKMREAGIALGQEINALKRSFILGYLVDASGRLEGEAINFNVTNAVFDVPFQLASRTVNLFGNSSRFNFRFMPAGIELGRNLRSENEVMQKYYIGRFKFGGELHFIYEPEEQENAFPKRLDLSFVAVDRYLFRDETAFDQTTKKASGISKGHKPWYQMDLKVFVGTTDKGRFGFRVNRIRGTLPPTFNDTRAYTFGAIFESSDDSTADK